MDLYSPTAIRLRTEMEAARSEMLVAKLKLQSARGVCEDAFTSPDGAYGYRVAARDYDLATDKYRVALKAWADHVLDS